MDQNDVRFAGVSPLSFPFFFEEIAIDSISLKQSPSSILLLYSSFDNYCDNMLNLVNLTG